MFVTLTVGPTGFGLSLLCKGKCGECEICLHLVQALSSSGMQCLPPKTGKEGKLAPAPLGNVVLFEGHRTQSLAGHHEGNTLEAWLQRAVGCLHHCVQVGERKWNRFEVGRAKADVQ